MYIVALIIWGISSFLIVLGWLYHMLSGHKKNYSQSGGYNYPYKWDGSQGNMYKDIRHNYWNKKSGEIIIYEGKEYVFRSMGENKKVGYHFKARSFDDAIWIEISYKCRYMIHWTNRTFKKEDT